MLYVTLREYMLYQVIQGGVKTGQKVRAQDSDITFTTDLFTVDYPCLDNLRVYQEVIPCSQQWQKQLPVLRCLLMELGIPHVLLSLGPVYHEYCECPEEDPQAWQKTLSCPDKEPQIEKDFASFPSINLQQMLIEVPKRFGDERGAIVHYTILNNHIYRRSLGKYTDFKMFSDEILLSLARKV